MAFLQNPFDKIFKLELISFNYDNNEKIFNNKDIYNHICFETEEFDDFLEEIKLSEYVKELPTVTINDLGIKSMFILGINNEMIQILSK